MKDYLITDTELVFKLEDTELAINLKKMRLACPCAHCKGEKDVFGNVYKGAPTMLNDASYQVHTIRTVGSYAIRIFWKDQHAHGIYTFDFLKQLGQ